MNTPIRKPARRKRTPVTHEGDTALLAEQIDAVATLMRVVSERMEYYAVYNAELLKHSREMAGASVIAKGWAKAIREPKMNGAKKP